MQRHAYAPSWMLSRETLTPIAEIGIRCRAARSGGCASVGGALYANDAMTNWFYWY